MSRILVTGASGFVGQPLVEALKAAGHDITAPTRAELDLAHEIDWPSRLHGMDAVVHLAGIAHTSGIDEALYDRINHRATAALAIGCAETGAKLVFVSSIRAQSGPSATAILTERSTPAPTDAYGRSKLAAEQAIAASGTRFSILRPVLMFGAGVKGNLALLQKLARLPVLLPFASLGAKRSLLAVEDLVGAIALCLESPATDGQTYVVAHPTAVTLPQMIAALRAGLGRAPGLLPLPESLFKTGFRLLGRPDLWQRLGGALEVDPAKLLGAGWMPAIAPEDGLRRLISRR